MRPALERLLSRPYSLDLLRYLTSTTPESPSTVTKHRQASGGRHHATCAAVHSSIQDDSLSPLCESSTTEAPAPISGSVDQASLASTEIPDKKPYVRKPLATVGKTSGHPFFFKRVLQGKESTREWTFDELTFESALDQPKHSRRKRLVDQAAHRNNLQLWAELLAHRRRVFGIEGVKVIWDRMKNLKLKIPFDGYLEQDQSSRKLGHKFWNSFIDLGLRKRKVLDEIVCYADENYHNSQGLSTLYVRIIQHFALQGNEFEVKYWHERLVSKHPPSAEKFRQMVRTIAYSKGDLNILQYLYEENPHRNVYSSLVPTLCDQMNFADALKWHHLLISHQDLPQRRETVKALQSHLEFYYPKKASIFNQSLRDAGVDFDKIESTAFKLSWEMMNRIHGQHFGIKEKPYNDRLGARWFATTWVSLDLAINSIHALGVREIGPLSLQEIALREPVASKITQRILQLKRLEISIGNSKYSRAVEIFARKEKHSLLKSLLESDQHPDALEDWKLQEAMLGRYASAGEWRQYARTVAIRLIGGPQSKTSEYNVLVRDQLTRPEVSLENVLDILEEMRMRGLPLKPMTSRYLIRKLLRPRRRANRPIVLPQNSKDLETLLSILKNLLKSGSWVPQTVWIEVMKRLGMEGNFAHLETLCLSLADWYHPQSQSRQQNIFPHSHQSPDLRKFEIPADIKSSHPKHPFSLLFPPVLQNAIVGWGFYSDFRRFFRPFKTKTSYHVVGQKFSVLDTHTSLIHYSAAGKSSNPILGGHPSTQGIRLLCLLHNQGVYVHHKAVRTAVIERLIQYYAPGHSNRRHNRAEKNVNPFSFHELVDEVEAAWSRGGFKKRVFTNDEHPDLRDRITRMGEARTRRFHRKLGRVWQRSLERKGHYIAGSDQIF